MKQDQHNEKLWAELSKLDEAGNFQDAMALATQTPLNEDVHGQRYIAWAYAQLGKLTEASSWYLKAAKQGNSEATDECYECAKLLEVNAQTDALVKLCESWPLSTMEKFQRLMVSYYYKEGLTSKIIQWSTLLAEKGQEKDLLYVGQLHLSAGEPSLAVPFLERAAKQDNGEANQLLGEMFKQGVGVEPSEAKALSYYEKSSSQGFILSKSRLLHIKKSRRGPWYFPVFVVSLMLLIITTKQLSAKNANDPRLSLLIPAKKQLP